ncbi:MAG: hypothetical protein ACK6A8_04295, partial [Planctomycetota bacterium]
MLYQLLNSFRSLQIKIGAKVTLCQNEGDVQIIVVVRLHPIKDGLYQRRDSKIGSLLDQGAIDQHHQEVGIRQHLAHLQSRLIVISALHG